MTLNEAAAIAVLKAAEDALDGASLDAAIEALERVIKKAAEELAIWMVAAQKLADDYARLVASLSAVLDDPDDTQEWERDDGVVEDVAVVRTDRVRGLLPEDAE